MFNHNVMAGGDNILSPLFLMDEKKLSNLFTCPYLTTSGQIQRDIKLKLKKTFDQY